MEGFSGFTEVRRELQKSFRQQLVNLAIQVDGFSFLASRTYVNGRDLVTGRSVRAALAERRSYDGRPTLADRREQLGDGGRLILTDAWLNRNGIYEALNALPFQRGSLILTDGLVRVSVPRQRDVGAWSQSIQHLRTDGAIHCTTYPEIVDAALAALAEEGPGRAAAVVRGWHAEKRGGMSFEIARLFDRDERAYLPPENSFDAFLAAPDVYVGGLNTSASGERCLEILSRLMNDHPDEIVWEVIPKRTYSMGGLVAEAAGLGTRRDASAPYRSDSHRQSTGFMPSVVAFVERDGVAWPRFVGPQRGDSLPQPLTYVATANVTPVPPQFSPARVSGEPGNASKAGAVTPSGAPGRIRSSSVRRPAAMDPVVAHDAPPPMPPDLAFPSFPASGEDMPDLSAFDGIDTDDLAALSRLEDLAAGLGLPNAA